MRIATKAMASKQPTTMAAISPSDKAPLVVLTTVTEIEIWKKYFNG